ncbi:AraC family transcriptional regulator [Prolixibacteraceae bacterium]|nr:AraC family transcriptional regulator [Prolixibacteraceae bacterium]
MKHIKFNKTLCGVDFFLNVIEKDITNRAEIHNEPFRADFFQIVFINQGKGDLILNDQSISLKKNQVLFISQHQNYKWILDPEEFHATFLVFQEDFLNDFFSDLYFTYRLHYFYQSKLPLYLQLPDNLKTLFTDQLKEIKTELVAPKPDSVHLIRSILYYILARLNRLYSEKHHISISDMNENMAFQFRRLVEEHIRDKQRIEDYTTLMNISRITLNKAVKKQFNQTTSEFLKARTIHEIKMELIYTNKSIDELSLEFNFSESNHLSRFFKMQTGLKPSDYRVGYQNGSFNP